MLVQMNDLVATSFTFTNFGEIFVVGDNGANATDDDVARRPRDRPGRPEPRADGDRRRVVQDRAARDAGRERRRHLPGAHVGILDYDFGEYRIQLRSQPVVGSAPASPSARSTVAAGANQVSIATFNVENLAGNEPDAKYNALAGDDREQPRGARHRRSRGDPGQQRRDGERRPRRRRDRRRSNRLVAAIQAAGGPTYSYRQIDPVDAPGRRRAGRQHPRRLPLPDRPRPRVRRSPGRRLDDRRLGRRRPERPRALREPGPRRADEHGLEREPQAARGRVHLQRPQAVRDREPLQLEGRRPAALRPSQPPVLTSEVQRNQQATLLAGFVGDILAAGPDGERRGHRRPERLPVLVAGAEAEGRGPDGADRDAAAERSATATSSTATARRSTTSWSAATC